MEELIEKINLQLENIKNGCYLIGSSSLPFKEIIKYRSQIFDLNAAEINYYKRTFPDCDVLNHIEKTGMKSAKKYLHLSKNYDCLLSLYSGTIANQVVYNAILNKNDMILSLSLDSGGHPSHQYFLKKYYNYKEISFPINKGIDYQEINKMVIKHRPKLVVIGTSFYPNSIDYKKIYQICKENNSLLLADISHTSLYISAGIHSPINEFADFITMTTNKATRGIRSAILYYKKKYRSEILFSLSPLTQGAPKYTDILANTIMFLKLNQSYVQEFSKRIINTGNYFIESLSKKGIKCMFNKTESHLIIIQIPSNVREINVLKEKFNQSNIYVNFFKIKCKTYIRLGVLQLCILEINSNDLEIIINCIANLIKYKSECHSLINKIMQNYTEKYLEEIYG